MFAVLLISKRLTHLFVFDKITICFFKWIFLRWFSNRNNIVISSSKVIHNYWAKHILKYLLSFICHKVGSAGCKISVYITYLQGRKLKHDRKIRLPKTINVYWECFKSWRGITFAAIKKIINIIRGVLNSLQNACYLYYLAFFVSKILQFLLVTRFHRTRVCYSCFWETYFYDWWTQCVYVCTA